MLEKFLSFIDNYDQYAALAIALITLAEAITNLTPSEKDNSIVNKIKFYFDLIIPNRAKTNDPETKGRFEIGSRLIKKLKNRKND